MYQYSLKYLCINQLFLFLWRHMTFWNCSMVCARSCPPHLQKHIHMHHFLLFFFLLKIHGGPCLCPPLLPFGTLLGLCESIAMPSIMHIFYFDCMLLIKCLHFVRWCHLILSTLFSCSCKIFWHTTSIFIPSSNMATNIAWWM